MSQRVRVCLSMYTRVCVRVHDLFGAQQRGPVQQQPEFGVSLCRGGVADEGGEGDQEEEEAAEA